MKVRRNLLLALLILAIAACASTNEQTKYYSLNLASQPGPLKNINPSAKKDVNIGPVLLAKFLDQNGLVMQVGENEVVVAAYHRWASPLGQSIGKLLMQELNNKAGEDYQFEFLNVHKRDDYFLQLILSIDKFHATDSSIVIVSGHYDLFKKDNKFHQRRYFNLSQNLTENGYPHSVEKLKLAISELANHILNSVE